MKKNFLFIVSILSIIFSSCKFGMYEFLFNEESVDSRTDEIRELTAQEIPSFEADEEQYTFVMITDVHTGSDDFYKNDDDFLKWFSSLFENSDQTKHPKFFISLGDNIDTGREYKEYNEFLEKMKYIVKSKTGREDFKEYSVLGNHDLYYNGWENFKDHIFPYCSAYHFSDGTFSYYFLDSANGTLGQKQRNEIEDKFSMDLKPKIILTHCPFYFPTTNASNMIFKMQDTAERNWILTLFAKNNVRQIFAGHVHDPHHYDYGKFSENALGAFKKSYWYLVTVNKNLNAVTLIEN